MTAASSLYAAKSVELLLADVSRRPPESVRGDQPGTA
jgi:hypothetical protein